MTGPPYTTDNKKQVASLAVAVIYLELHFDMILISLALLVASKPAATVQRRHGVARLRPDALS